ncbi:hypothetical protein [Adlercreutzia muris]|uniref:hypothetical protein n=1 Tax=Adlercreutzia muris TaxID=1796610 RepID=UPI001F581FB2|nr:hypothetical protein [Adlercreutzia muris]
MRLNVSTWEDFKQRTPEELYELICAYDNYIKQSFDNYFLETFEYEEAVPIDWEPASMLEFANSEEFEIMREEFQS